MLLLAVLVASCLHVPQAVVVPCPDIPDEVIDEFGPKGLVWWTETMDPYCESLEDGIDAS